jgi:hypothetical protein
LQYILEKLKRLFCDELLRSLLFFLLLAEISTGNFIVMTGISKKGKTTDTRHGDVIIRLENVKCAISKRIIIDDLLLILT